MNSTADISVLLASDIPMLRSSMLDLFNDTQNVSVVACAESQSQVRPLASLYRPKLAILDLEIEREELHNLVRTLTIQKTSVLLMSDEGEMSKLYELFVLGLRGILQRRTSPDLMRRSVHAVAAGELWLSRQKAWELVDHLRTLSAAKKSGALNAAVSKARAKGVKVGLIGIEMAEPPQKRYGLTRREGEIIRAIGEAMTNKDIAVHFGISEYTVKHHLTKIFDKVGVDSRLELAMFAKHHGLVPCEASAVA